MSVNGLSDWWVWVVAIAVVAMSAALLWRARTKSHQQRFEALMRDQGEAWIRDLYIPDGMDGQIHVPHVLRTAAGFLVVDVVRVHGPVFGGTQIDEWTVIVNGHSRKFRNPVATNRARMIAVRGIVPGIPVHGVVLLLGDVTFPKGQPDSVETLQSFPGAIASLPAAAPARTDWDEAWYGLAACATSHQDAV